MLNKRCQTVEFYLYGNLENLEKISLIYNQQFPRARGRWKSRSVCMGILGLREVFYNLIVVVVTQVYKFVKTF